jgi:hypothetical protein
MHRWSSGLAAAAIFAPLVALADPSPSPERRGVILRIEDGRAIVDLGRKQGVREKMLAHVRKRYVLVHPVTQAKIEDELPLGDAVVERVSESIAAVYLGNVQKASVGDAVVVDTPAPPKARPPVRAGCAACERDPASMKVHVTWMTALSQDARTRRDTWRTFLHENPKTPYRPHVEREIAFLSTLLDPTPETPDIQVFGTLASLDRIHAGDPLSPAVILPEAGREKLRGVYLYYRRAGAPLYAQLEMSPDGDGYYRAEVPANRLSPPAVEYFVEALDLSGRSRPVFRSASRPWPVEVEAAAARPDDKRGRSEFRFAYQYVDFYLPKSNHDFYWQMDASFTYKVDLGPFAFFRLGFGYFEGYGGEAVRIEQSGAGSPAKLDALSFGFVYLEPELRLHEYFAVLPRLVLGQIDRQALAGIDSGQHTARMAGGYGFLRIGRREGTNLLLGAGATENAGFETQITMNLALFEKTPLTFSAIVSNFPVQEDIGLILRAGVARQVGDWMEVGATLGFAARNINHAGVSLGTTLAFKW